MDVTVQTKGKAVFLLLAAAVPASAQVSPANQREIYRKAAPSVVAIRARALGTLGEHSGTGVVLSPDGLILTSTAVCPRGATHIRVWIHGPRRLDAELVAASRKHELALIRIKPKKPLTPIELGRSSPLRIGDVSYTLGNAANSIITDAQPSLNAGVVSGMYRLSEPRANADYVGPVIETTAAVNVGMEGAPCLDAKGRMVGLITLNYSPHRFLGVAIPIDEIRQVIGRLRKEAALAKAEDTEEAGAGHLGLTARLVDGKVVVATVDKGGPAEREGLQKGDVILKIGDAPVRTPGDVAARIKGLQAGSIVWITIDFAGQEGRMKLTLEEKK